MEEINYLSTVEEVIPKIKSKGALLVAKSQEDKEMNVMTIGWTALGYIWRKPIMLVMVRKSRFTHQIIEKAASFTVNVPADLEEFGRVLDFCGSKSGREVNKFQECNLAISPGQKVNTPIINFPGVHYEAKIVYKSAMNPDLLCPEYQEDIYADNVYHTFYFGEIMACYKTNH